MERGVVEKVLGQADELIVEAMNERATPGCGVGIISGSETVYAKGFGLADVERGRPVTPKTVFRIGSISKTMTAIGLMQLWERGRFDLDDPVNEYLRNYRVEHPGIAAPPVTFRHMLTHTSGIGELRKPTDLFRPMIGLGAKPDGLVPTTAEYYAKDLRPAVYPGTKWAYSNHAFNVLGQLVEDISGEPFDEYMRKNVFGPLGMENTDNLRSERVREELAQGYNFSRGRLKPVKYMEILVRGAGSVFSSVEDMCRYAAALLGRERAWKSVRAGDARTDDATALPARRSPAGHGVRLPPPRRRGRSPHRRARRRLARVRLVHGAMPGRRAGDRRVRERFEPGGAGGLAGCDQTPAGRA
jgi:CubicO group peptidase (beta-lactamase class C family)